MRFLLKIEKRCFPPENYSYPVISQLSKNTWPKRKNLEFPRALPLLLDLVLFLKCQNLVSFKHATVYKRKVLQTSTIYKYMPSSTHVYLYTHAHPHTHIHTDTQAHHSSRLANAVFVFGIHSTGKFCGYRYSHTFPLEIETGVILLESNLATSIKSLFSIITLFIFVCGAEA